MKKVRYIPAVLPKKKCLRVAAYCRVSTSKKSQLCSLEMQKQAYMRMIENEPEWNFAGLFCDIGSGLRRTGRAGLNELLKKVRQGKIDYIITKSISRVSRDTVELLTIIRFLRERGINMHFETENLDSIRENQEFEITLRAMLAQDESRNTSENILWGFQRKFENGSTFKKYKNFMGYSCVNGEMVIVPEQAETVRKIFDLYLQGLTFGQIKMYLESMDILTVTGKENWDATTIQKMLKNEKYKGDSRLQKTVTEDFMTGRKVKNVGQRTQYYVPGTHPAIVSEEIFDRVQEEMKKRARIVSREDGIVETASSKYNGKYLLGNLLVCGNCGASYRRRRERGKVVWRCATRIEKGKDACAGSPTINEEWLNGRLAEIVCGGIYEESMVRDRVENIRIFENVMIIGSKGGENLKLSIMCRG